MQSIVPRHDKLAAIRTDLNAIFVSLAWISQTRPTFIL
jgi:hypothetical protein